jgi:phage-related protein
MIHRPFLDVRFFKTPAGNEPVRGWLKDMDKDDRKVIGEDIKTVQFGWPMGMPIVEKFEANLRAVRTDLPRGRIARTFFTVEGQVMVLLHGMIKKSQKTPLQDLNTAKKRLAQLRGEE